MTARARLMLLAIAMAIGPSGALAQPNITKVAVIWNKEGGSVNSVMAMEEVARPMRVEVRALEISRPSDIADAFSTAKSWGAQGIVQVASPVFYKQRASLLEAAARHKLPMMCEHHVYVVDGCLATYSASLPAIFSGLAGLRPSRAARCARGQPADRAAARVRVRDQSEDGRRARSGDTVGDSLAGHRNHPVVTLSNQRMAETLGLTTQRPSGFSHGVHPVAARDAQFNGQRGTNVSG